MKAKRNNSALWSSPSSDAALLSITLPFIVGFSLIALLLFYSAALPGEPAADGRVIAGGGNPIPGAATLAAVFGMVVGILVIWMSEHTDRPNTVWTKAPSIWRPLDKSLVVEADDDDDVAARPV